MEFVSNGRGYERILNSPQYKSQNAALQDAHRFFSDTDGKSVLCFPNGDSDGEWILQYNRLTANGEVITEVVFEDFRPVKRMTSSSAKVELWMA